MDKQEFKHNDIKLTLYNGDCLDKMKDIPSGSVDMILTDPPYEISNSDGGMLDRGNRKFIKQIDKMGMCKSNFDVTNFLNICLSLFECKKSFCGVFFCSMKQLSKYLQWGENNNLQCGVGVWHKSNPIPLCNFKYLNDIEYWVYIKGNKSKILGDYYSKSMMFSSQVNNKDKKLYKHPTIKPINLMEKFIVNHSIENKVILDPFMGSGSTGVACKNLNRNFIGIELDKDFYNIACDRIQEENRQTDLEDFL